MRRTQPSFFNAFSRPAANRRCWGEMAHAFVPKNSTPIRGVRKHASPFPSTVLLETPGPPPSSSFSVSGVIFAV